MTEILEECPLDTVDGIERLNAAEQLPANWALLAADFRTEGRAARRLENKRDVYDEDVRIGSYVQGTTAVQDRDRL